MTKDERRWTTEVGRWSVVVRRLPFGLPRIILQAMPPFDPDFDDARWTLDWAQVSIMQIPTGSHPDGYLVIERHLTRAQIFDRIYEASEPFPVRALLDPSGGLWMSDTPQERMMMHNNAMASRGHILIGGLGLAMYPQYAAARATRFTVVEQSRAVIGIVGPTLKLALSGPLGLQPMPFEIIQTDVSEFLSAEPTTLYDTIFLDTWDTLDAANLPRINRLRDLALRHLAPGGRVLLWGYGWMVRLFEDACRRLLSVPPAGREAWLAKHDSGRAALLRPVVEHFKDMPRTSESASHMKAALRWCRTHVADMRSSEPGD
jgi:hypothetical protein